MPLSFDQERTRSMLESVGWPTGIEPLSEGAADERTQAVLRRTRVRDYKDRFILRQLQEEARHQNPGFCWLESGSQNAFVIWVDQGRGWEPAGYSIIAMERWAYSKYERRPVLFPETLSQIYVRSSQRRRGFARALVKDHMLSRGHRPVWVESPKWETRAILAQLGYEETEERYEVWQMMEGLTKWVRRWDL